MHKRYAPSTERNRDPLLAVFRDRLKGRVLELASGTGQHARYFSEQLGLVWQPTDPDSSALASIAAWREGGPEGLLAPIELDVHAEHWPVGDVNAVVAVNLVHISPWSATEALFAGASRVLVPGGCVFLYGPYRREGVQTSESNERFEEWLLGLDPRFGLRNLEEVQEVAERSGFLLEEVIEKPANNLVVVFKKLAHT